MSEKQSLGEILIQKQLVSAEKIEKALKIQTGGNRRLGHILIQMGLIKEEELFQALSDQHGIPVAKIDEEMDRGALKLIPRYLCKKYSVIPLSVEDNNVLKMAMVNPLDQAARTELENFTHKAIVPSLSKETEIEKAIHKYMPLKISDIFFPFRYNRVLQIITAILVVVVLVLGVYIKKEMDLKKYGTTSKAGNLLVFSNHEMLIGVEGKGAISLIGHGPYAKGFYSVVFNDVKSLKEFINTNRNRFTDLQYEWILWVADKQIQPIRDSN